MYFLRERDCFGFYLPCKISCDGSGTKLRFSWCDMKLFIGSLSFGENPLLLTTPISLVSSITTVALESRAWEWCMLFTIRRLLIRGLFSSIKSFIPPCGSDPIILFDSRIETPLACYPGMMIGVTERFIFLRSIMSWFRFFFSIFWLENTSGDCAAFLVASRV